MRGGYPGVAFGGEGVWGDGIGVDIDLIPWCISDGVGVDFVYIELRISNRIICSTSCPFAHHVQQTSLESKSGNVSYQQGSISKTTSIRSQTPRYARIFYKAVTPTKTQGRNVPPLMLHSSHSCTKPIILPRTPALTTPPTPKAGTILPILAKLLPSQSRLIFPTLALQPTPLPIGRL